MNFDAETVRELQHAADDESEDEPDNLDEELRWATEHGNNRRPLRPGKPTIRNPPSFVVNVNGSPTRKTLGRAD